MHSLQLARLERASLDTARGPAVALRDEAAATGGRQRLHQRAVVGGSDSGGSGNGGGVRHVANALMRGAATLLAPASGSDAEREPEGTLEDATAHGAPRGPTSHALRALLDSVVQPLADVGGGGDATIGGGSDVPSLLPATLPDSVRTLLEALQEQQAACTALVRAAVQDDARAARAAAQRVRDHVADALSELRRAADELRAARRATEARVLRGRESTSLRLVRQLHAHAAAACAEAGVQLGAAATSASDAADGAATQMRDAVSDVQAVTRALLQARSSVLRRHRRRVPADAPLADASGVTAATAAAATALGDAHALLAHAITERARTLTHATASVADALVALDAHARDSRARATAALSELMRGAAAAPSPWAAVGAPPPLLEDDTRAADARRRRRRGPATAGDGDDGDDDDGGGEHDDTAAYVAHVDGLLRQASALRIALRSVWVATALDAAAAWPSLQARVAEALEAALCATGAALVRELDAGAARRSTALGALGARTQPLVDAGADVVALAGAGGSVNWGELVAEVDAGGSRARARARRDAAADAARAVLAALRSAADDADATAAHIQRALSAA